MARKKITYKKQDKEILALTVFGHGNSSYYWSIGNDPNIVPENTTNELIS